MKTAMDDVIHGRELEAAGDLDGAVRCYASATQKINRFGPAKIELDRIAKRLFADAIRTRDTGDLDGAIALLVRSVELNADSGETRAELQRLLGLRPPRRDLTTECLIYPDRERGQRIYREAILRCVEFVAYGGMPGDVLEFGVLGGWTARIFAETMRDLQFLGKLHLFDSFEGLPPEKHERDRASYDVQRGVWSEDMRLPARWEELGPLHLHVADSLSTVLSRGRIHVHRGFFADTLAGRLDAKAAIVHLDCDLYESTIQVLLALHREDVLQDGTVLMFDDWNCNRANPAFGQRRALAEFLAGNESMYSVSPFFSYGFNCAAFILHRSTA
jgi:tetratricopeptide (TPR) repeat protein